MNGKKATRLCPCGHLGDTRRNCRCTPDQVARYRARLSGPLLDRIDLVVEVPALADDELLTAAAVESSAEVAARVERAWAHQQRRQGTTNARLAAGDVGHYCVPDEAARELLRTAGERLGLSARAHHRLLRVARSIADLAGSDGIGAAQVAEAIQYRRPLPGDRA